MKPVDYLIVGGGAAGTTAAETLRTKNPTAVITLISQEQEPLYSRVLLPYYLKGERKREDLFLKTAQWYQDMHITFLGGKSAEELNTTERSVVLNDHTKIPFHKALIASGGRLRTLAIPGEDLPHVHYLRTLTDADSILATIQNLKSLPKPQQHVAIVGGGFIGLELAASFAAHGISGTIIIRGPYYWSDRLDKQSGEIIQAKLNEFGFTVIPDVQPTAIQEHRALPYGLVLSDGREISARAIGIGIGVTPSIEFLKGTPLAQEHGVLANEYLETSLEGIFAAGDCAEFLHPVLGRRLSIGNWTNSTVQGRLAGRNMKGEKIAMTTISSYSATYFGTDIAFIGDPRNVPDTKVVAVGDNKKRAQFFVWDKRLVGATLINMPEIRGLATQLIQSRTPIPDAEVLKTGDLSQLLTTHS